MRTPIYDFVTAYAESDTARLHMPGHKGSAILGAERYDITEISGADTLYHEQGIIAESEENAARLFGTKKTYYSTEGSTLAIKAMLATALLSGDGSRTLLCARGVHKSLIYAAAELDFGLEWLYPERGEHFCSCTVTPESLRKRLSETARPFAVYITSPDYLGRVADIASIAEVCHENRIPLLVDNAHGAYLAFTKSARHPIALGADMCADSAHKTLPVLTGGAYLHISHSAPSDFFEIAPTMLSAFASTSPSYLILTSLDLCNERLACGYGERIDECIGRVLRLKLELGDVVLSGGEPMKITVRSTALGYSGEELAGYLRTEGVEVEYADGEYTVLMPTPENSESDFSRVTEAMKRLPRRAPIKPLALDFVPPVTRLLPRAAVFSKSELVSVSSSVGRICAAPTAACPPAVPIVISGELITEEAAKTLLAYGIEKIRVVK